MNIKSLEVTSHISKFTNPHFRYKGRRIIFGQKSTNIIEYINIIVIENYIYLFYYIYFTISIELFSNILNGIFSE